MDEVKANMLGWQTSTLSDVHAIHHRTTGAAYGTWNDRVKNGLACYITGYHPLFMLLKCIHRIAEPPYLIGGLGLLIGFLPRLCYACTKGGRQGSTALFSATTAQSIAA